MEQLLMGLSTSAEDIENDGTIQFTYATTTSMIYSDDSDPQKVEDQDFFATVKAMDELMARTYGKLKQVSSVALRLPTVYGPIGRQGSLMYELAEKASKHWSDPKHLNHTKYANTTNNTNTRENASCLLDMIGYKGSADLDMKDLLFVDGKPQLLVKRFLHLYSI
jgi:nucleoside-diphosphate-sugar epimerase